MPANDIRLYPAEEVLNIASRLQQERSILAKTIAAVVSDREARQRYLGNARAGGSALWLFAPTEDRADQLVGFSPTTTMDPCATQPLAQHDLTCLDQQHADQIQHAGAPSAQVAVPFDALEGVQATGIVDHLQDTEVAARQLGGPHAAPPAQAGPHRPGSRADAQSPVMQPVQTQPVVTVAAGEAGTPAVELDEEAVQRHRKETAISSWHADP